MLFYKRDDGKKVTFKKHDNTYIINIDDGVFHIQCYNNGKVNETYAPMNKDKAIVYLVALIQGFQPPRSL